MRIFVAFEDMPKGFLYTAEAGKELVEEVMAVADFEKQQRRDHNYITLPPLAGIIAAYQKEHPETAKPEPQIVTPDITLNAPKPRRATSKVIRDSNTGAMRTVVTEFEY